MIYCSQLVGALQRSERHDPCRPSMIVIITCKSSDHRLSTTLMMTKSTAAMVQGMYCQQNQFLGPNKFPSFITTTSPPTGNNPFSHPEDYPLPNPFK